MLKSLGVSPLTEAQARQLSASNLAYVGDAMYDLYIRTYVVLKYGDYSSHKVNKIKVKCVNAAMQAAIAHALLPDLPELEAAVLKRGRNFKSATVPKNSTMADYRYATGFEALVGYLAISDQQERLNEVLAFALKTCFESEATQKEVGLIPSVRGKNS